jgi:hypothetical protein
MIHSLYVKWPTAEVVGITSLIGTVSSAVLVLAFSAMKLVWGVTVFSFAAGIGLICVAIAQLVINHRYKTYLRTLLTKKTRAS